MIESPSRVVTLRLESEWTIVDRDVSWAWSVVVLYHPSVVMIVSLAPSMRVGRLILAIWVPVLY